MENKEKLIQLFKQCCDSPEHEMFKSMGGFHNCNTPKFNLSEQPYEISEVLKNRLESIGFENIRVGSETYYWTNYGREFTFDSKPPLLLSKANVQIRMTIPRHKVNIGHVTWHDSKGHTKYETYEHKGFFRIKKRTRIVPVKYHSRSINVDKDMLEGVATLKETLSEAKSNIDSFYTPWIHKSKCLISGQFDGGYMSDDRRYMDGLYDDYNWSSMDFEHFNDTSHVYNTIKDDNFNLKGGIIAFGDIWVWLQYDEYVELNEYYMSSIKRTHEKLLEQRLSETKEKKGDMERLSDKLKDASKDDKKDE